MTRSARSLDTASPPRAHKLRFDGERVGLIDAAAEGDDGVLHVIDGSRAQAYGSTMVSSVLVRTVAMSKPECLRPMSRRYCMPSKRIARRPRTRARSRPRTSALADDGHHAAAAGDQRAVLLLDARVRTPAHRDIRRRLDRDPRCAAPFARRPDTPARPARRRRAALADRDSCDERSTPVAAAHRIGVSGSAIIGSTTCASGSPKRTLNSMTFGPSAVSIKPQYSTPR